MKQETDKEAGEQRLEMEQLVKASVMIREVWEVKLEKWVGLALERPLNTSQTTEDPSRGE